MPQLCTTCDRSPRWGARDQCLECLSFCVPPCEVVPKTVIGYDAADATRQMQRFREQWEVQHPGWELHLDRERIWPDVSHHSKYADKHTMLCRKRFYARFRVMPRHPRPGLRVFWHRSFVP